MSLREEIKKNEYVFPGSPSIKYYFKRSLNPDMKTLLIGFSGFHGNEKDRVPPKYNYIKHLRNVDVNQLYILDGNSNHIPLYYIGENGNNYYEEKVIQLILYIAQKEDIPLSNIITFGSSKGGTAAAYFAMKYSLGNFISAGMQTRVGDYLLRNNAFIRNEILGTIVGKNVVEPAKALNERFMRVFNNPSENTNYYLHGGKGDFHFLEYVMPFYTTLEEKGVPCTLDVADYEDHSEIGQRFLPFLLKTISEIYDIPVISEINSGSTKEKLNLDIKLASNIKNTLFAIYIFDGQSSNPIMKLPYQRSSSFSVSLAPGKYRCRIYSRKGEYKSRYNTGFINVS